MADLEMPQLVGGVTQATVDLLAFIVFGDPVGSDALAVGVRSFAFVMVVVAGALIPAPVRAAAASRHGGAGREVPAPAQAA